MSKVVKHGPICFFGNNQQNPWCSIHTPQNIPPLEPSLVFNSALLNNRVSAGLILHCYGCRKYCIVSGQLRARVYGVYLRALVLALVGGTRGISLHWFSFLSRYTFLFLVKDIKSQLLHIFVIPWWYMQGWKYSWENSRQPCCVLFLRLLSFPWFHLQISWFPALQPFCSLQF